MSRGAFEASVIHRLAVETARYWLVEHCLRTGDAPEEETWFCYPKGPDSIEWGADSFLRSKRISVTLKVEDIPQVERHDG